MDTGLQGGYVANNEDISDFATRGVVQGLEFLEIGERLCETTASQERRAAQAPHDRR